ncbi:hypothetical protein GCM10022268_36370 [Sphingomonas cynarae]|uniref:Uncharacterized protein n=1 Tax=Sphingomonas cynarae TaxID=930197 RepID=A0ABP7EWB6_9SPHN
MSRFGGKDRLQAFAAIGTVVAAMPCQVGMAAGFGPWRRDVRWDAANAAPVRPLPGRLASTGDGTNREYRFRFGLFGITGDDGGPVAPAVPARRGRSRPPGVTCRVPAHDA